MSIDRDTFENTSEEALAELSVPELAEDVRAFIDAAESGEFGPVDPGLEATVRIARALLEHADGDDDSTDE